MLFVQLDVGKEKKIYLINIILKKKVSEKRFVNQSIFIFFNLLTIFQSPFHLLKKLIFTFENIRFSNNSNIKKKIY